MLQTDLISCNLQKIVCWLFYNFKLFFLRKIKKLHFLPSEEGGVVPSGVTGVVGIGLVGVVIRPISGWL